MHLTRIEPDANLYRFYRIEIVRGLFGDRGLVRNWGRIGSSGRLRTDWFDTEAQAKDARFDLNMAKAKRGYEQAVTNVPKPLRFCPGVLARLSP